MSIISMLKAGKKNVKVVKFPGTDTEVAIQILTVGEGQEAVLAVEAMFKEKGLVINASTADIYQDEETSQILFRALCDPDGKVSFAKSVDDLKKNMTVEEKNILAQAYEDFEAECSPKVEKMTESELDDLLDQVKKNPLIGNDLSIDKLRRLLTYSVSRLATSQPDSGSTS